MLPVAAIFLWFFWYMIMFLTMSMMLVAQHQDKYDVDTQSDASHNHNHHGIVELFRGVRRQWCIMSSRGFGPTFGLNESLDALQEYTQSKGKQERPIEEPCQCIYKIGTMLVTQNIGICRANFQFKSRIFSVCPCLHSREVMSVSQMIQL